MLALAKLPIEPAFSFGIGIIFFTLAFVLASLVEYWLHRLMHISPWIGERHRDHHRRNEGHGALWAFRDYVRGSLIVLYLMFFLPR
ncbi:sterol desaturase family protein, partial [Aetokthonos hydrillicola]|uniref:sterol desaturase family protein n=1 Tax=Aetokthonos hydrillicola TaxID=1550245 RepID=UPI001ABAEF0E